MEVWIVDINMPGASTYNVFSTKEGMENLVKYYRNIYPELYLESYTETWALWSMDNGDETGIIRATKCKVED